MITEEQLTSVKSANNSAELVVALCSIVKGLSDQLDKALERVQFLEDHAKMWGNSGK